MKAHWEMRSDAAYDSQDLNGSGLNRHSESCSHESQKRESHVPALMRPVRT